MFFDNTGKITKNGILNFRYLSYFKIGIGNFERK